MSTTLDPAIEMKKLNALIGQFVTDLGTAAHTGMVSLGKNWDFTKPSPVARYLLKRKKLQLQGLQQSEFVIPPFSLELIRHAAQPAELFWIGVNGCSTEKTAQEHTPLIRLKRPSS